MTSGSAEPIRPSLAQRVIAYPLRFGRDWAVRFVELQGFDRAVALAGQAFTALVPLLIVYSALVSKATGRDFADDLIRIFDLSGSAAADLKSAFVPASAVQSSVSFFGAFLLVVSALSFTRALQRLYQLAWHQPSLGLRAAKWGLIWLVIVIVLVTVRPIVVSGTGGVLRVVVSLAIAGVVWLLTPLILLGRRVAWQRLVATGVLTGFGMTVLAACSAVWMPHTVASSAAQFGVIGVAFALLGWLVGAGMVLVLAASGGVVVDEHWRARRGR